MVIEAIVSAVALLISGGATYYAREKALPEIRKRDLCHRLSTLLTAIEGIARTGEEIGAHLGTHIYPGARGGEQVGKLFALLEVQSANLIIAQREFQHLALVFQVQLPKISHLVLHLRGKKDRIEIIYTTARDVHQQLRARVAPWEVSRTLGPVALRRVLAQSRDGIEISRGDSSFWENDPDFRKIVAVLPELRRFVHGYCQPEYLV